jgi:hypothetical protein
MADNNQLDDLFRRSFDQLPESPSPNGWDQPSERVWQGIQQQVAPGTSILSTSTLAVAFGGIILVAGLAFYLLGGFTLRPTHQEGPVTPPPPVRQEEVTVPPVQPLEREMPAPVSSKPSKKQPVNSVQKRTDQAEEPATKEPRSTAPVKNSIERRQSKENY